uniref:EamA domain-containing protein n=1 Tax=Attheya septentrionalis TaxID=420275 RepID=A0A7S2XTA2_9STRA|mmetsp:Transcript_7070/g.12688  ORF Transcript_7070/g.12688 Transcript_7070/m.12688 type:complete len:163 (+) Transcript_7070:331-819(+)|eukprot:CAMPEP_0198286946 /NCGR_PEP_ID=MMETSP1449-20131203/5899_1 /TAXON_ID=420275 /ORGANISM="Attheya septentrionalis, Strain CCMP2084" /LENGTH=162 /DNA_ID=CAMNT_0043984811 /DNA_START=324 /DNA_END=812 /DNA_ORIENTATION=-
MTFSMELSTVLSLLLVGAVWGCTNPFLRRGAVEGGSEGSQSTDNRATPEDISQDGGRFRSILRSLSRFLRVGVWFPYALNQCGSLLYYKLLATEDLTLSVPICNALALLFSSFTSYALGERVDKPYRAALGSILVTVGVGLCLYSREVDEINQQVVSTETEL